MTKLHYKRDAIRAQRKVEELRYERDALLAMVNILMELPPARGARTYQGPSVRQVKINATDVK